MPRTESRAPRMPPRLVVLLAAALAACVAGCVRQADEPGVEPAARPTELVILFLGDVSFGEEYLGPLTAITGSNPLEKHGYGYPFENFRGLLASADHVVANLEAPVTAVGSSPFKSVKKWVNRERPGRAPGALARAGIDAVSLGNNHALDYGPEGLLETFGHLEAHGIAAFGAGRDEESAAAPHLAEFPLGDGRFRLAVVGGFEVFEWYDKRLSWYARGGKAGVRSLDHRSAAAAVEAVGSRAPDSFVVAFPHWGLDWKWRTTSELAIAHALVRGGADLVIGHGAHRLQEVESVRGTPVVFGLGDFVFNSYGGEWVFRAQGYSLIAALRVRARPGGGRAISLRLYPIVTDSLRTGFRPRFVTAEEFEAVLAMLKARPRSAVAGGAARLGEDRFGRWIELPLATEERAE